MAEKYFLLIDGHALIYRAFHAFPGLTTRQGKLVNAVYGFTRILLTAIRDFQPTYIAVAFDHKDPTFRHKNYVEYKANRVEMPEELKPQIQMVKDVVTALNIPQFELPGFEADDLIGTLSLKIKDCKCDDPQDSIMTVIVTGDRDAFQLVDENTHVWMPGRGKGSVDTEYDRDGVKHKMDVYPEQIVDLKALMGDSSDNIPGVAGIGEKTATKLIQEFETLENLYKKLEAETSGLKGSVLDKLKNGKDMALLSQDLATIDRHVPIELDLDACRVNSYHKETAVKMFEEFDFKSLIPLLPIDDFEMGVQSALF